MTKHGRFCGLTIGLALLTAVLIIPSSVCAQDPVQFAAEGYFSQGHRMIAAADLFERLHDGDADNDPYVISVRSTEDYARGHIATAVHMDTTSLFTPDSLATLPPDRDIVVVSSTGQSACQITSALNMLGYRASCLTHGMSSWTADPEVFVTRFDPETHANDFAVDTEEHLPGGPYARPTPLAADLRSAAHAYFNQGIRVIKAAELFESLHDGNADNDPYIISIRSAEDYAEGHIATAVRMDAESLFTAENLAAIPPDQDVVVVSYTGETAGQVTSVLNMLGYDAFSLLYGMSSWTTEPRVFAKRFEPEKHAGEYYVRTETYLPEGTYELPLETPAASTESAPSTTAAPELAAASVAAAPPDNCVTCHTNRPLMQKLAVDTITESEAGFGEGWAGELAPTEGWERALVYEEFLSSMHNAQGCIGCHGGVAGIVGKDPAHEGMVRDPLEESSQGCDVCHPAVSEHAATSLHRTLEGFRTALSERGADFASLEMQAAWSNHCSTCHTTCGQCHISRPTYQSGGLLNGHEVEASASMGDTCAACHGARAVSEYRGDNEGVQGSVHWLQVGMSCDACHDADEFHGDGTEYSHRYDGSPSVDCLGCHEEIATGQSRAKEHRIHRDKVDCYVCHVSGPYRNCFDCHVALDEQGLAYFETAESQMDFKIGRNLLKGENRPWEYALVRHVPVTRDTFAYYGEDLLPSFDNRPTWTYATPHNIQRQTPQTRTCEHCHGNPEIFLLTEDVSPEEASANAGVVVERVPVLPHPGLSEYDIPEACTGCHPRATEWNWELVNEGIHSLNQVVEPTGTVIGCEDCHSHPGLLQYDIPDACTGCHPQAGESEWELVSASVHSLNYAVRPAGTVIECEDCHLPEGSFDWAAAGFSSAEVEELMWTGYAPIEADVHADAPSSAPYWLLGMGLAVAAGVVMPLFRPRNRRER